MIISDTNTPYFKAWDIEVDLSSGVSFGEVTWTYPLTFGTNCDRYGTLQLDFQAGARTEAHIEVQMNRDLFPATPYGQHLQFHLTDTIENGYGKQNTCPLRILFA